MLAETLRRQYAYTDWATRRILDTAANLTSDQLNAPGAAGHGSIRDTLIHVMQTHKGWLSWWDGSLGALESYGLTLDREAHVDIPAFLATWTEIERQTARFVAGLTDANMVRRYSFDLPDGRTWSMELWGMMLHVMNHGTQHRTEVATMLTEFGRSPGDLDLLFYLQRPLDAPPEAQA